MIPSVRLRAPSLVALLLGASITAGAQDCIGDFQYPEIPPTPAADGTVTEIATCSFEEEHSRITGIEAGSYYELAISTGGYITVRQGTFDGPILGQGYASVVVNASTAEDLFAHWNTDEECGTAQNCAVTTIQNFGNCAPAQATYTFSEDCDAQTYTILLDIASVGSGASVDVQVDVNGDITVVEGVAVGEVELGPFALTDVPVITLLHDTEPSCNRVYDNIQFRTGCPLLIQCGAQPVGQNYCYEPEDTRSWLYTSVGTGTLRLRFLRGTIESSSFDNLRIFDGTDATGTLLYAHDTTTTVNLGPVGSAINNAIPFYEAIDVFSTSGSIFMQVESDDIVQCGGSTTYDPWEWQVTCLDCTLPEVSYAVSDDCANGQFSILVDVVGTGDGATVELVYTINAGADQTVTGVGTGIAEIGPFSLNDTINMRVVPNGSELCIVELGDITDTGLCPVLVDCGIEVQGTLCYGNMIDQLYIYRGTGTFPLGVFFDAGTLFFGDSLIIYDGGDINAPRLFAGDGQDVADLFVNTTNPEHLLTIRIRSNGFTACSDSGSEPLAWRVACLDCVPAAATFELELDCTNNQFYVAVSITDLGSDAEAEIMNDYNAEIILANAAGVFQVGPFPSDTVVVVTIVNDANFLCNVVSLPMVNPVCPVTYACPGDGLEETYCYTAFDSHAWSYELASASPTSTLRLRFIRGTVENNTYDRLTIYDGSDNTGTVLFEHNANVTSHLGVSGSAVNDINGTYTNYYGVDVGATSGTIYMEMSSDVSVQCGSGSFDAWLWEVYCVDCADPAVTFNIVPDCSHRAYLAEVTVTATGGDDALSITDLVNGGTMTGLGEGVHTFGPISVGTSSQIQVFNETYAQCRATSPVLSYTEEECVSVTCGFDEHSLCYENNDERWYTYRSAVNAPITVGFLYGQLIPGDSIFLYNGADETAGLLYEGNNGGNLAGFAINSSNAENTITMRIKSDASGSCADGQAGAPLTWNVACGAVGMVEADHNGFVVFPNPTQGLLHVEFATTLTGPAQARVLDMSGRIVLDRPLQMSGDMRNVLDMRGLQSGNYVVQLTTTDRVMTQLVQLAR